MKKSQKYQHLDLREEKCPMTFVRTRLALEQLPFEQSLRVDLLTRDVCDNVTYSVEEFGSFDIQREDLGNDHFVLMIKAKPNH